MEEATIKQGELPPTWLERQVLTDYLDWCKTNKKGEMAISEELINEFINDKK